MFNTLKLLVTRLEQLDRRAAKYRSKEGRIEIPADDYNQLAAGVGEPQADKSKGPVELSIDDYVQLIDEYIAAVVDKLNVEEAIDKLTAISPET